MIYLQRSNNRKKSKLKRTVTIGVVTLVLIIGVRWIFPGAITSAVGKVAVPLWQADNKLGGFLSKSVMFIKSRNTIIDENRSLKEQLEKQKVDIATLSILEKEYQGLKEMYGRNDIHNKVVASILATPPETPYDVLVLDVNNGNGIKEGNVVMSEGNVALGKISEINDSLSKVLLFSSPNEKVKVFIERSTTSITLVGRGGGSFESEVPQDTDIVEGDTLILPGLSFPIIGKVVEIDSDVQSSFKKVLVRSEVNFSTIRFVEVLSSTTFGDI